jgi:hypothetical protein
MKTKIAEKIPWRRLLIFKFAILLILVCNLTVLTSQGQTKKPLKTSKKTILCKIGATSFKCPDDFQKEQIIDKNTILFKQNYNGSITYFFVAIPEQEFDDTNIRNIIAGKLSKKNSDIFQWKKVEVPIAMDLETKYEKKIVNRLGYNSKLVNFMSRYFEFNGKTIILGYGYDTDSDGFNELFESGEAIGDNAIGCNAIATTLNSITKEKKGKLQYCSLTALTQ